MSNGPWRILPSAPFLTQVWPRLCQERTHKKPSPTSRRGRLSGPSQIPLVISQQHAQQYPPPTTCCARKQIHVAVFLPAQDTYVCTFVFQYKHTSGSWLLRLASMELEWMLLISLCVSHVVLSKVFNVVYGPGKGKRGEDASEWMAFNFLATVVSESTHPSSVQCHVGTCRGETTRRSNRVSRSARDACAFGQLRLTSFTSSCGSSLDSSASPNPVPSPRPGSPRRAAPSWSFAMATRRCVRIRTDAATRHYFSLYMYYISAHI